MMTEWKEEFDSTPTPHADAVAEAVCILDKAAIRHDSIVMGRVADMLAWNIEGIAHAEKMETEAVRQWQARMAAELDPTPMLEMVKALSVEHHD